MARSEENEQPKGTGTDFIDHQSDIDKAKDQSVKDKSAEVNKREALNTKTDVSQKKTGGGKQVSPGT